MVWPRLTNYKRLELQLQVPETQILRQTWAALPLHTEEQLHGLCGLHETLLVIANHWTVIGHLELYLQDGQHTITK